MTDSTKGLIAALANFEEAAAAFPPAKPGYAALMIDTARAASDVATSTEDGSAGPSRSSSRSRP
ncbi:MAG TPA: hypothetical protein VGA04_14345 [Streptosporangiaceae bacterium]